MWWRGGKGEDGVEGGKGEGEEWRGRVRGSGGEGWGGGVKGKGGE